MCIARHKYSLYFLSQDTKLISRVYIFEA